MRKNVLVLLLFIALAFLLCDTISARMFPETEIRLDDPFVELYVQENTMATTQDEEIEDETDGSIPRRMAISTNDYHTGANGGHTPHGH